MQADPQELLRQWQAQEQALRARMVEAGVAPRSVLAAHSGVDFLDAIVRGELPRVPIGETLNFMPVEVAHGRVVFQGTPKPAFFNPIGSIHGGWAATLLDSCMGCAVHSTLPRGRGYTTLEIKVNYVRALLPEVGPVRAEGRVINVGGRVGTAEGRIVDSAGKLYAHATTTCLIFDLPTE